MEKWKNMELQTARVLPEVIGAMNPCATQATGSVKHAGICILMKISFNVFQLEGSNDGGCRHQDGAALVWTNDPMNGCRGRQHKVASEIAAMKWINVQ